MTATAAKKNTVHTSRSLARNISDLNLRQEVTLRHVVTRTVTTDRSTTRVLSIPGGGLPCACNGLLEADEQVVARVLERLAERYNHLVVLDRQVTCNHHLRIDGRSFFSAERFH